MYIFCGDVVVNNAPRAVQDVYDIKQKGKPAVLEYSAIISK